MTPVSRFNVIIIQSRSRGGSIFAVRNSRNSSSRYARFPLSPIRGAISHLSRIGSSQPVRDIISLFIVDSVPPRLISLSFFAGPRPWARDRKMCSSWGTRIYLVDVCHGIHLYTEKSFVLYILKRRRRRRRMFESPRKNSSINISLFLFETVSTNILRPLFFARIKSSS